MKKSIAVIGTGLVGSAWAIVFARAGHNVVLFDEEADQFDRALALASNGKPLFAVLAAKADLSRIRGRFEEAFSLIEPHLDSASDSTQLAIVLLRLSPRVGRAEEAIAFGNELLGNPDVSPVMRMRVLYAIGAALDSLGRFDEAFEAYAKANVISPSAYDASAHASAVDDLIASWTPEATDATEPVRDADAKGSERALFVVGMPRSGTSLVEQIIASHPDVHGGGELAALGVALQSAGAFDGQHLTPPPGALSSKSRGRAGRSRWLRRP